LIVILFFQKECPSSCDYNVRWKDEHIQRVQRRV
jgi:hypothetical protein